MAIYAGDSSDIDEEEAKEWEHTLLQDSMDKELHELNKRLEQKEVNNVTFKMHFELKTIKKQGQISFFTHVNFVIKLFLSLQF